MKKLVTILLSLAIICTMAIAPMATNAAASLDALDSAVFFNVDFNTGTADDLTGNYSFREEISGADLIIEDDADLGRKVALLEDEGNLIWENNDGFTFQGYDLSQGFTMEQVLYINTDPSEYRQNQSFMELNYGSIHFQEYNDATDHSSGFRLCSGTDAKGNFDMCNAYTQDIFPHKQWIHIAGTSDGTNNYYYLNGQLVATFEGRPTKTADTRYGSTNAQVLMGESIYGSMFGSTIMNGKVALARIYKATASADEVKALYERAMGGEEEPTPAPATPTTAPGPDPSVLLPLKEKIFFDVDYSTGTMDDQTGNYEYMEEIAGYDPITFTDDETIGKKVLEVNGDNYGTVTYEHKDGYTFLGYNLNEGLTLEAYIKLTTDPLTEKRNLAIVGAGYGYFGLSEYNDSEDYMSCFIVGDGNNEQNFNMGIAADMTKIFPHNEWVHLVGTSNATTGTLYVNGQAVATYTRNTPLVGERYNTPSAQINLADSIYGSMWGDMHTEALYSFVRVYKACADADQVQALYAEAQGIEPAPTPVPGEATPTPTPEPTPEIDIPTGDAYQTSFGEVPAFKAGETVNIPLVINGITTESGIMGFDIAVELNGDNVATEVNDEAIQAANAGNETLAALNGTAGKWSVSGRMDGGKLLLTILDENAETTAKAGDEIVINIPTTATADTGMGAWVAVVTGADGTDGNVETVEGSGSWAFVSAPSETPTPEPGEETPTPAPGEETPTPEPGTETPTPVPGEETPTPVPGTETPTPAPGEATPTQAPSDPTPTKNPSPLNPTTFDPGILGLVAVSLSALVTTKRRKKD